MTHEINNESQVQELVEAAVRGDLTRRIDAHGLDGSFGRLVAGMNQLMQTNEQVINDMQRVFGALANGNLTETVQTEYLGVYDQLKRDANKTVSQLTDIISKTKHGASVISVSSGQLKQTNTDLSTTAEDAADNAMDAASGNNEISRTSNLVIQGSHNTLTGVNQVLTSAEDLSRMAIELAELVERFNVGEQDTARQAR